MITKIIVLMIFVTNFQILNCELSQSEINKLIKVAKIYKIQKNIISNNDIRINNLEAGIDHYSNMVYFQYKKIQKNKRRNIIIAVVSGVLSFIGGVFVGR